MPAKRYHGQQGIATTCFIRILPFTQPLGTGGLHNSWLDGIKASRSAYSGSKSPHGPEQVRYREDQMVQIVQKGAIADPCTCCRQAANQLQRKT